MPDDNVWLAQRRAEQQALARLLKAMQSSPRQGSAGRRMRRRCPAARSRWPSTPPATGETTP